MENKIATWNDVQHIVNSVMDTSFKLGLLLETAKVSDDKMEEIFNKLKLKTLESLAEHYEKKATH